MYWVEAATLKIVFSGGWCYILRDRLFGFDKPAHGSTLARNLHMNFRVASICLIILPALCAQTSRTRPAPPVAAVQPLTVVEMIGVESSNRTEWYLAFNSDNPSYRPKTAEQGAADFEKFVTSKPDPPLPPKLAYEFAVLARNKAELSRLASVTLGRLIYIQDPVRLATKDGELTLFITSIGSDHVYNTLRLDTRQRAAKEIQASILPELKQFRSLSVPSIKNYGVIAIYGTKDFSQEDSSPRPELVALVASASNCRKLADATITEEDLVAASDVYVVDEDDVLGDVRKVKVVIGQD